jgi:hypothetical protein
MISGKDLHFRSNFDLLVENFLSNVLKCRILVLHLCVLNQITMSKKKKKVDSPQAVTAPTVPASPQRRSKQKYPRVYLLSVADRLLSTRPPVEIILNTLKDIWLNGWESGYVRRIEDGKSFAFRRDERRKHSYDMALTNIENLIHGGTVTKPVEK